MSVAAQVFAARDDFERTLATGWGSALTGGAWNTTSGFSVSDGVGKVALNASQTRANTLTSVSRARRRRHGGPVGRQARERRRPAHEPRGAQERRGRVPPEGAHPRDGRRRGEHHEARRHDGDHAGHEEPDRVHLHRRREAAGAPGDVDRPAPPPRSPRTCGPDGAPEPAGWFLSTTDGQAELQAAGQVGVLTYLSGSTTNTPVTVSVDDLKVIDTAASAPPVHADPVASFTAVRDRSGAVGGRLGFDRLERRDAHLRVELGRRHRRAARARPRRTPTRRPAPTR